ncbi:MAG: hypothetical protein ABIF85_06445 [Nanoarchaeota archaeon]|nr:hypothetical protein [archaeon]
MKKHLIKGSIDWGMIIKIILALIVFVVFFTIMTQTQTGSKDSACGGLLESFKAYVYEPLGIPPPTKLC